MLKEQINAFVCLWISSEHLQCGEKKIVLKIAKSQKFKGSNLENHVKSASYLLSASNSLSDFFIFSLSSHLDLSIWSLNQKKTVWLVRKTSFIKSIFFECLRQIVIYLVNLANFHPKKQQKTLEFLLAAIPVLARWTSQRGFVLFQCHISQQHRIRAFY